MILFSKSTLGFFDSEIMPEEKIPADAVEIEREYHQALLSGEAAGKVIAADEKGYPVLANPAPPSLEELSRIERHWRDFELATADNEVRKHEDQAEGASATEQEWRKYRNQLRSWPEAKDFPDSEKRPVAPV